MALCLAHSHPSPSAHTIHMHTHHATTGHEGVVSGLALISPTQLLSVGHDGTMRLWDLSIMKQLVVSGC